MKNGSVKALNKFELSVSDPIRDVDNSPYGGQCLSFLSFKIMPGTPRKVILTAQYRNHILCREAAWQFDGTGPPDELRRTGSRARGCEMRR